MTETKNNNIAIIIKTATIVLFAMFFVILLSQYITMAQLEAKKSKLEKDFETLTTEYTEIQSEYENIRDNYEEYVESTSRNNYDYGYEDDVLINKN